MKKINHVSPAAPTRNWLAQTCAFVRRQFDSTYDCGLLVLLIAAITYLPGYASPRMFWDENYHVTSAQRFIEGIAQFEAHPPLGKLLIAAGEVLTGANKNIDKHVLTGSKYIAGDLLPKGFSMTGMRLMPSLFAVFAAVCFFGLMFSLTQNRLAGVLLSALYVFENAYIVHFRAAHLDSFQLCFSLGALWYFVTLWRSPAKLDGSQYARLAGLIGLAIMIKINGVLLLTLFPLLYWQDGKKWQGSASARLADFLKKSGAAVASILAVTFLVFWISALCGRNLPDPQSPAGRDDISKMSPQYQQFLTNHEWLTPIVVAHITVDYFAFMSQSHEGVPKLDQCKTGENGSYPLNWPLMDRTINYRWDAANGKTSYVQLVGNVTSWSLGFAAVILSLGLILSHRVFNAPVRNQQTYALIEVFSALYLVFMGLHLWLGAQRVMYLYHYFLGLSLSYALVALNGMYLSDVRPWFTRHRTAIFSAFLIGILGCFVFIAPLTYHYPISKTRCEIHNWPIKTLNCI